MANATLALPPLPEYTLSVQEPLVAIIPDKFLSLVIPVVAYWVYSMVFHLIDVYDLFPQYRLHTPAEILNRNHVSRWEVVRDVVIQHVVQTLTGIALAWPEPEVMVGKEEYDINVWARRIRVAQRAIPSVLGLAGIDSEALSRKVFDASPQLSGVLAGGSYPWMVQQTTAGIAPAFSTWELALAKFIFWVFIPFLQFAIAIFIIDTWQYFLHRAMHMNRWLYVTLHSRHHRLYVPYAYGALYNHPVEGFLLDTCGAGLAYLVTGMTPRQAMCLFTGSTLKTVDDHCGYAFPWDPLQHLTSNNAGYHDVHHQTWGIKTNFSQPFFTVWDRMLGTVWAGGDVSARYERSRLAAQKALEKKTANITGPSDSTPDTRPYETERQDAKELTPATQSRVQPQVPRGKAAAQAVGSRDQALYSKDHNGAQALEEEHVEELRERASRPRQHSSASQPSKQLRGLRDRVSGGAVAGGGRVSHGSTGGVLGYEGRV